MRYLSKTFPNPVLVFSTLRESLEDGERKKIARLAETGPVMVEETLTYYGFPSSHWRRIRTLTAKELCPYSGAEGLKGSPDNRSLDYGSSLTDICRITRISFSMSDLGTAPILISDLSWQDVFGLISCENIS